MRGSGYRPRKCIDCGCSYAPASGRQKYCNSCGIDARMKINRGCSNRYNRKIRRNNPEAHKRNLEKKNKARRRRDPNFDREYFQERNFRFTWRKSKNITNREGLTSVGRIWLKRATFIFKYKDIRYVEFLDVDESRERT